MEFFSAQERPPLPELNLNLRNKARRKNAACKLRSSVFCPSSSPNPPRHCLGPNAHMVWLGCTEEYVGSHGRPNAVQDSNNNSNNMVEASLDGWNGRIIVHHLLNGERKEEEERTLIIGRKLKTSYALSCI